MKKIDIKQRILTKNDTVADEIRAELATRNIKAINLIGSPGSGKTTLLEAVFGKIGSELKAAVIEGDVKTDNDTQRILALGVPSVQIETQNACHLSAEMVKGKLADIPLGDIDLLVVENVGNLICPVAYDLGETVRAIVISVAEGEDKPLKYPSAFASSDIVVVTKTDLAPYVEVSPEGLRDNALSVNPKLKVFLNSAKTGDGIDDFISFLKNM